MIRRKLWSVLALSVVNAGFAAAQMPAVVVSDPVFRPVTTVTVTPPAPVTTITTLETNNVGGTLHKPTPSFGLAASGTIAMPTTPTPQPVNYLINPYFGYYQTQWRPFPGATSGPGCEAPPVVRETFVPIGTPNTPVLPPLKPEPMVIPPKPIPMMIEPPKPEVKDPPKPELKDPPKLDVSVPPKSALDTPLTPPTPPKPLLLNTPPSAPSKTEPTGGPRLPVNEVTPPIPPEVTPVGFAETRRPAVTEPKKMAKLGLPQPPADGDLPIIRSAIKADDTQRPDWPVIRTGNPGK